MKTIIVKDQRVNVYNIDNFPYWMFKDCSTVERNSKSNKRYADVVCAFDIETTTFLKSECDLFGSDFGFMYVWQFCINEFVCMGRTWEEYKTFISKLKIQIDTTWRKIPVYVHNLAYEFQFMKDFFHVDEIFCRGKRDVVYCCIEDIEYRCSYILSNMSLKKFLEKSKGVTFPKMSGDKFNYKIKRYPDTELTDEEIAYCICDVVGLVQAIKNNLIEDTLATIPITSTGYVRRDFKEKLLDTPGYKRQIRKIALNETTYQLCREASRGAISGSNHIHTEEILEDVDSFDIKSSYPFQMATKEFPQSKFIKYNTDFYSDKFQTLRENFCCIITWECENLKLKKWKSIPYISKAKCRAVSGCKCGNGKVYMAKRIGMCCTEIDLRIIEEQYTFDNPKILEIWCAQKGMLAKPFRQHLLEMFQMKTNLEDGDVFLYNKYKNKINAAFGMMLTDILHPEIQYVEHSNEPWKEIPIANIQEALNEYYNKYSSFLSYQHGVWVLAHGRDDLNRGMKIVGHDLVQVDTDSVKTLGDYKEEFNKLNQTIIDKAENYDVKPYSIKNMNKHYLGIWEHEGNEGEYTYKKFSTLGAKKYAYTDDKDKLHITVSGLTKKASEYLETKGGINAFKTGTVIPPKESGRTASVYNDWNNVVTIKIDSHEITLGSNIAIHDVGYTLGMAAEWLLLVLDGKMSATEEVTFNGAYKNYG